MNSGMIIWLVVALAGLLLYYFYARLGRLVSCVFTGAMSGFFALALLWIAGHFVNITIATTPLSLTIAAIFGAPGVIGMLVLPIL